MKKGVKTVLFAEALSDKTNKDDIKDITLVFLICCHRIICIKPELKWL